MNNHEPGGESPPLISVVILDSRSKRHPEWVEKCIDSVMKQSLQQIELIVLDNTENKFSIGKMYNDGMEMASCDWVYMLNDDDYVTPDYFASFVTFLNQIDNENVVMASTYSTFFDEDQDKIAIKTKAPLGAYYKPYFGNRPFNEDLPRHVDMDLFDRTTKDGKVMAICSWHFGYFYRQHSEQVSGRKLIKENT